MSKLPAWVTEYAQTLAEAPAWLNSQRQQALERFAAEGWPTTKQENWHHTSLVFLEQAAYQRPVSADAAAQVKALQHAEEIGRAHV
jgi:Fe-S cluster assembly protein SufD